MRPGLCFRLAISNEPNSTTADEKYTFGLCHVLAARGDARPPRFASGALTQRYQELTTLTCRLQICNDQVQTFATATRH